MQHEKDVIAASSQAKCSSKEADRHTSTFHSRMIPVDSKMKKEASEAPGDARFQNEQGEAFGVRIPIEEAISYEDQDDFDDMNRALQEMEEEIQAVNADHLSLEEDVVSMSQATVDLPIATEVPTPPELLERLRQLEEQERKRQQHLLEIPKATPYNVEAENRANRRSILWFAAIALLVLVITAIILGVTLTRTSDGNDEPTLSPTGIISAELRELIESISFDRGAALNDTDSPQHQALEWLASNENLTEYPNWKRIQRYTLTVLYYSTNGDDWSRNNGWLSDDDECTWYSQAQQTDDELIHPLEVCDGNGKYAVIRLEKNNLIGSIPSEVALLSNSLCKYASLFAHWSIVDSRLRFDLFLSTIPSLV